MGDLGVYVTQDFNICVKPALVRRDVNMQLFSPFMNASLSITASCHARSGPGFCCDMNRSMSHRPLVPALRGFTRGTASGP